MNETKNLKVVGKPIMKKDAMQLLLGKPSYVDDITPKDCLVVKLLRSPHAHALIKEIKKDAALKVDGIEAIYTYEDVPQERFTLAGQSYPEPSPYDRLILDKRVRFVGDPVAIVAGETEKAVDKAIKLLRVKYDVLEPIIDLHDSLDNEIQIHPEENWKALCPVGADNKRNLCATGGEVHGNLEEVFDTCDEVFERTYHTQACNQTMMETFRTYAEIDHNGRLHIVSSTQIVFHVRRILSNALGIPKSKIRVEKPRIGGGFGAKQTAVSEIYPAFVTWMTKKPSKIIYTREESQIAASPRHEMEVKVKIGAMKDGTIRALDVYTLSNTGAFGEHGPTTVGLSGHKSIPLYTANMEAFKFSYDVVYTNVQAAGAYRGYGATQGIFAVESIVNELAARINVDPALIREKNMVREGQVMPAYYNEKLISCNLDKCLERAKQMIDWDNKYPSREVGNGKVRSVGIAMAMQGSGISGVDVGSATIKLNDDGFYSLIIGAAEMGTGCDTTLSQIAAECMQCSIDDIAVIGADTDISPYDSGSYASSTAYVTGMAVKKACEELKQNICKIGAKIMDCKETEVKFLGNELKSKDKSVSIIDVATKSMVSNEIAVQVTASHSSKTSPPPFMVGAVEIELDKYTGNVDIIDYVAVVDCGTALNPNLVRVQVEGGLVQGIGMALTESVSYNIKGGIRENSFMEYKIPSRMDMGKLRVEFENSYEKTGPYGAKSIGEIVINTPSPALAHAVYNATKVWHRELPITPEKILLEKDTQKDNPKMNIKSIGAL